MLKNLVGGVFLMGKYSPRVEKNHPDHFGQNKVGQPVKTCRYCQGIWKECDLLVN